MPLQPSQVLAPEQLLAGPAGWTRAYVQGYDDYTKEPPSTLASVDSIDFYGLTAFGQVLSIATLIDNAMRDQLRLRGARVYVTELFHTTEWTLPQTIDIFGIPIPIPGGGQVKIDRYQYVVAHSTI